MSLVEAIESDIVQTESVRRCGVWTRGIRLVFRTEVVWNVISERVIVPYVYECQL